MFKLDNSKFQLATLWSTVSISLTEQRCTYNSLVSREIVVRFGSPQILDFWSVHISSHITRLNNKNIFPPNHISNIDANGLSLSSAKIIFPKNLRVNNKYISQMRRSFLQIAKSTSLEGRAAACPRSGVRFFTAAEASTRPAATGNSGQTGRTSQVLGVTQMQNGRAFETRKPFARMTVGPIPAPLIVRPSVRPSVRPDAALSRDYFCRFAGTMSDL